MAFVRLLLAFELALEGSGGCWLSTNFLAGDSGADLGNCFGGGGGGASLCSLATWPSGGGRSVVGFCSLRVIQASLFLPFLFPVLPEAKICSLLNSSQIFN